MHLLGSKILSRYILLPGSVALINIGTTLADMPGVRDAMPRDTPMPMFVEKHHVHLIRTRNPGLQW